MTVWWEDSRDSNSRWIQNDFALSGPMEVKHIWTCCCIVINFSNVHLKELWTSPQRSLKTLTSVTLTTKQWIRWIKTATSKVFFFFFSCLCGCTAIWHWQQLMLRHEWFVQAWQNFAGRQQGHRGFSFQERASIHVPKQEPWMERSLFAPIPQTGGGCLCVQIKNTAHEELLRDTR